MGKYQTKKKEKKVGDQFSLHRKFRPFKKGYLPGWTEEVFRVRKCTNWMTHPHKAHFMRAISKKYIWIKRLVFEWKKY